MFKSFVLFRLCLLSLFLPCHLIWSQEIEADYLFPIHEKQDGFHGAGVDWIMDSAADKQFVLIGEQHGIEGIAALTRDVYDRLHPEGFHHLVLETDAWTAEQLNEEGLTQTIQNYPFAIAFDYDEDLELIETALTTTDQSTEAIWGIDQVFIAIHPFDHLRQLAHSLRAKRLANGAFLKAALRMGNYIREDHLTDLEQLEIAFQDHPSEEVREVLEEIRSSMEIYTIWASGDKSRSSAIREQFMKDKFDAYLRANSSSGLPKAIIKLGGAHTLYGIGPNGVLTLGDHAREVAIKAGSQTLSLGIRRFHPEYAIIDSSVFGEEDGLLLDTKRWMEAHSGDTMSLTEFQRRHLQGFDGIIYFKDATSAKKTVISPHERVFRSRIIKSLIPIGILALLCLTSLIPAIRSLISSQNKKLNIPILTIALSSLILVAMIIIQLLWIRSFPSHSVSLISGSHSFFLYLFFFALGMYHILMSFLSWKHQWWTSGFRLYISFLVLAYLGLTSLAYYWNLGGMLG